MKFRNILWLLILPCCQALAAEGTPLDLATRYGHYYADYVLNADGTATETHEWSRKVLKESALERSKRASVTYSTSAQQAEVLVAYTLKADGRHIDVPKNNYQLEVNSGKGKDAPVYSDWSTLSVVFPDVAVGDSVVFGYKLVQTEAMFPGHFSTAQVFSRNIAYDDIRVRFDYPAEMWTQYEAREMKERLPEAAAGRKRVEWSYANPLPLKSERRDFSVYDADKEVGYAFSTFRDYAAIAAAYGARALPKAAVDERISRLAAEIVGDAKSQRDQARALYEWVARNITYAGNCIGIGAVVPRDMPFILDNKMGDCKDHATLLQALLAARGIEATQALVNSGATYRLQRIPVVQNVNHVINYLPDLNLFVDSTSDSTPFGMLPFGDQDKPVLLVEKYREGMKTPITPAAANRQVLRENFRIAEDGSVSGNVEVQLHGQSAVGTREWSRQLSKEYEEDLVKEILRAKGMDGSGRFVKDDPQALIDSYRYQASFQIEKFIKTKGVKAFNIESPLGDAAGMVSALQSAMTPEKEAEVTCTGMTLREDYQIELPPSAKLLSVPENLSVGNELVSYKATYRLKGKTLMVSRVLEDRTRGNVCSPQVFVDYKKIAEPALENLKEQVLYK